MSLVVPDDRLLAVPDERDRPLRVPCREREQRLDGEVFASAERAADLRVANRDGRLVQLQHRRDLTQIFVQPLPRRFDHQRRAVVVGDPGIGLKVRMLLPRRRERARQHDIGRGKGRLDVALADLLVQQHVGAELGMHERRVRFERRQRVANDRQVLVLDLDESRGGRRRARVARDHQRDAVAHISHALAAEQLLVGVDQAVAVIRHVGGAQHRHDAGIGGRAADVQAANRGVSAVRENGVGVQHPGPDEVRRIPCRAGHLSASVRAGDRTADPAHTACPELVEGNGSRSLISRAAASIASRILR